jgi:hypothetical protein
VRRMKCYDAAVFCLAQFFVSTDRSNGKRPGRKHLCVVRGIYWRPFGECYVVRDSVTFPCVLGSVVDRSLSRSPCALEMDKGYVEWLALIISLLFVLHSFSRKLHC